MCLAVLQERELLALSLEGDHLTITLDLSRRADLEESRYMRRLRARLDRGR